MTCLERLKKEHPEAINPENDFPYGCPEEFGYKNTYRNDHCTSSADCYHCWESECEEEHPTTSIKDSGDRTQFSSGAVRDMREGKGRFDLMPLEVVAHYFKLGNSNPKNENRYWFFWNIDMFRKHNKTSFLYSALNIFVSDAFKTTPEMLLEVSKHYEEGAKKYDPDNWKKGIPTHCYIDSAIRHYVKWLDDWNDEPHARAVIWNLMCCIWEVDYGDEWRKSKESSND